jgi:hypothetical protein
VTRAAALVLLAATAARGEDAPPADAIRRAREHVLSRPEFQYAAPKEKSFLAKIWDAFVDALMTFQKDYPTLFGWFLVLLGVVLVATVGYIVWSLRAARAPTWVLEDVDLDAALRRGDPAPFRGRAQEHAAAGRFDEAVRDLYAALLLTLDRRGAVRFAPHKALLDYRIEAVGDPPAARTLELFAGTYHPGSFGRRPPDRARFDELVAALDRVAGGAA